MATQRRYRKSLKASAEADVYILIAIRDKLFEAYALTKLLTSTGHRKRIQSFLTHALDSTFRYSGGKGRQVEVEATWIERLGAVVLTDRFLTAATGLGIIFSVLATFRIFDNLPDVSAALRSIWLFLTMSKAFGAEAIGSSFSSKEGFRYLILGAITIGFICALAILGFSEKADARKLAADMIKTILGIYAGMATKLID